MTKATTKPRRSIKSATQKLSSGVHEELDKIDEKRRALKAEGKEKVQVITRLPKWSKIALGIAAVTIAILVYSLLNQKNLAQPDSSVSKQIKRENDSLKKVGEANQIRIKQDSISRANAEDLAAKAIEATKKLVDQNNQLRQQLNLKLNAQINRNRSATDAELIESVNAEY